MIANDISCQLAAHVDALVRDLLPAGHREGHEWRCGSVAGEPGDSLGVHLVGNKRGVWSDFGTDQKGDALDLVREVFKLDMGEAIGWSRRWLGLDEGDANPASSIGIYYIDNSITFQSRPLAQALAGRPTDRRQLGRGLSSDPRLAL